MKKTTIGNRLADRRQARQMSRAALADKIGVPEETLAHWEADLTYPDAEDLVKLARALDIQVGDLLADGPAEEDRSRTKGQVLTLACQAIGLAAGVAVTILAILQELDVNQGFLLLGLGLAATGIGSLRSRG